MLDKVLSIKGKLSYADAVYSIYKSFLIDWDLLTECDEKSQAFDIYLMNDEANPYEQIPMRYVIGEFLDLDVQGTYNITVLEWCALPEAERAILKEELVKFEDRKTEAKEAAKQKAMDENK